MPIKDVFTYCSNACSDVPKCSLKPLNSISRNCIGIDMTDIHEDLFANSYDGFQVVANLSLLEVGNYTNHSTKRLSFFSLRSIATIVKFKRSDFLMKSLKGLLKNVTVNSSELSNTTMESLFETYGIMSFSLFQSLIKSSHVDAYRIFERNATIIQISTALSIPVMQLFDRKMSDILSLANSALDADKFVFLNQNTASIFCKDLNNSTSLNNIIQGCSYLKGNIYLSLVGNRTQVVMLTISEIESMLQDNEAQNSFFYLYMKAHRAFQTMDEQFFSLKERKGLNNITIPRIASMILHLPVKSIMRIYNLDHLNSTAIMENITFSNLTAKLLYFNNTKQLQLLSLDDILRIIGDPSNSKLSSELLKRGVSQFSDIPIVPYFSQYHLIKSVDEISSFKSIIDFSSHLCGLTEAMFGKIMGIEKDALGLLQHFSIYLFNVYVTIRTNNKGLEYSIRLSINTMVHRYGPLSLLYFISSTPTGIAKITNNTIPKNMRDVFKTNYMNVTSGQLEKFIIRTYNRHLKKNPFKNITKIAKDVVELDFYDKDYKDLGLENSDLDYIVISVEGG